MHIDLAALPEDVATLHRMIGELTTTLDGERVRAQAEIDRLRQIVKALQRNRFGRRSERLDDNQLQLGLEDLDTDIAGAETDLPPEAPGTERKLRSVSDSRLSLPDHLPRAEVTVDIAPVVCPCCGGAVHEIGETVSEMLDYVPARLRVLRIRRPKYGCRACGTIHQAPAPERPIAKGLATPGLIAHVLVSKYCDYLPLYRQSQILARQGVTLNRSTLANWVGGASWWLEALRERLADHVFASDKLFADDTPIPVLDPGRGRTKTGRLWVYARDDRPWAGPDPPAAVYFYSPDRRAERPAAHLDRFRGVLQVDGYAGFETLAASGEIVLAACWAHARRKFYEFHQATGSPIAAEALRRIAALYAIENEIRGRSAAERQAARDTRSRSLVDAMKPWLEDQLHQVPPRGGLAEAIRYALARWPALCRFLDDGRVELDNNPVERAIRPVALGRKNHLFAGSDGGADRWAVIASLLETAKLNRVEPYTYLKDILERMTDGHPMSRIDELLPWNWTASTVAE
ncbi:MAG: IS66 family transposase [Bauldia litoralis]|uniref:IS66 family transposase n=1 Tax=Marinovum algicola TaxID=42444 RepID=UPI0032ECE787